MLLSYDQMGRKFKILTAFLQPELGASNEAVKRLNYLFALRFRLLTVSLSKSEIELEFLQEYFGGTQREYRLKPLKHSSQSSIVKCILVFKR